MIDLAFLTLSHMLTLAAAFGMLFAVLINPRRETSNLLMAAFAGGVGLWALFSIPGFLVDFQMGLDSWDRLPVTAAGFGAAMFLLFVLNFTRAMGQAARLIALIAPVVLLALIGLVWVSPSSSAAMFVFGLVCVALGFLRSLIVDEKRAKYVRVPAFLLVLAYISALIETLNLASVDTLLAAVGVVWVGWVLLNFQLYRPLDEVSTELRTANRDLRQALTDLANTRAENEKMSRELREVSGYKGDFLTNMSHKVRTPLNSIVGYSELLESGIYGQMSEKQLDRLTKIHRNGKILLDLINNMLDLSKIEAGRLELNLSVFRLDAVVEQTMADLESSVTEKGLDVITVLAPELPPIYGDERRIHQVIAEMLTNAVKFTPAQGKVTLSGEFVGVVKGVSNTFKLPTIGWLRDGEWIVITVADTGIGIAPEDQARIFDEFYQVNENSGGEASGAGLGLAICKKLVELHNGVIWVKSTVGQGSTFYVALPTYKETGRDVLERTAPSQTRGEAI